MKSNSERHYFGRALDHEGEVLESFVIASGRPCFRIAFLTNSSAARVFVVIRECYPPPYSPQAKFL